MPSMPKMFMCLNLNVNTAVSTILRLFISVEVRTINDVCNRWLRRWLHLGAKYSFGGGLWVNTTAWLIYYLDFFDKSKYI